MKEKKDIKIIESGAGLNIIVGLEQTISIKPVNQYIEIVEEVKEKDFIQSESNIKQKSSYSFGYANILVLGLLSLSTVVIAIIYTIYSK